MPRKPVRRIRFNLVMFAVVSMLCTSCGGGGITAGVGGSGIGGTGIIANVAGNVASVDGQTATIMIGDDEIYLVDMILDQLILPAMAQSSAVSGIQVSGGGQNTVTDESGGFRLSNVTPSDEFELILGLGDGQQIPLGIGAVREGTTVQVNDIVVSTTQEAASASSIDVQSNPSGSGGNSGPGGGGDDDSTDDDNSGPGSSDDDDSTDDDNSGPGSDEDESEDDVSTDDDNSGPGSG